MVVSDDGFVGSSVVDEVSFVVGVVLSVSVEVVLLEIGVGTYSSPVSSF